MSDLRACHNRWRSILSARKLPTGGRQSGKSSGYFLSLPTEYPVGCGTTSRGVLTVSRTCLSSGKMSLFRKDTSRALGRPV